jgi:3-isopropylmalate/(R)-2-methylmalate dehydratase small subunit
MTMRKFTTLTSIAAPFLETHIDTDIIFPARFLLLPDKKGLGEHLFHERRHADTPFVLDTPPYDRAQILVAGKNFGTGSSREQAVWALADFGIRCVIAPSLGEIFFANCFKNGVLPIVLADDRHAIVAAQAATGKPLTIDLEAQEIRLPGGGAIPFEIEPYRKRLLLLGLDEIGAILSDDLPDIETFEARQRADKPWLYLGAKQLEHFSDLEE